MKTKGSNIWKMFYQLIEYLKDQEEKGTQEEIDDLWSRIQDKTKINKRKKLRLIYSLYASAAAAVIIGFVFISGLISSDIPESNIKTIVAELNIPEEVESDEILLVMAEEKKINVESNAEVAYSKEGTITVNDEPVEDQKSESQIEIEYDQLFVPKGKRTQLLLSDGSRLWVNSGSRVVYPRQFTDKTREIFLEGEAYLEVYKNEECPFIVKTESFDVEVLGTSFNISAYKELGQSTVVLVNGIVNVKDSQDMESKLVPNELITVNEEGLGEKITVDVTEYISWINGLMILRAEPLQTVMDKLALYYGIIIVVDDSVKDMPISGKLDLRDQPEDVIRMISVAAPINYQKQEDKIYINERIKID